VNVYGAALLPMDIYRCPWIPTDAWPVSPWVVSSVVIVHSTTEAHFSSCHLCSPADQLTPLILSRHRPPQMNVILLQITYTLEAYIVSFSGLCSLLHAWYHHTPAYFSPACEPSQRTVCFLPI
jgi:hypothetical protein